MIKTVTLCAAVLALAVSWLAGIPVSLALGRVRALRLPGGRTATGDDTAPASQLPPPLLGGLLLWLGLGVGFVTALLLAGPTLNAGGYYRGVRMAATLFGSALAFGFVGLMEDCLRIAGRRLPWWGRLGLQLLLAAVLLGQLAFNGSFSTLLCLPWLGWVDLGGWYYLFGALLVLAVCNSLRTVQDAPALGCGGGFVAALTFLILAMLMLEADVPGDRYVLALFAAALAGSCAGFLFWNFPPARLRLGGAGSGCLAGALLAMAFSLQRPELLAPILLPFLWNGLGTLLGRPFGAPAMHCRLKAAGWKPTPLVCLFGGLACLGSLLAVLSVLLYG